MTTVTPVTKIITVVLFVTLPFVGFYLGRQIPSYTPVNYSNTPIVLNTPTPTVTPSPSPTPLITSTPVAPEKFENTRMSLTIPTGWTYGEILNPLYNTNCTNGTNCVTDKTPYVTLHQGISLKKDNYVINILTNDVSQASGVNGGRFGDIANFVLNSGLGIDAANCIISHTSMDSAVKNNLYIANGFIDFGSSSTPDYYSEACGNPAGSKNLWYGSFLHTKNGGYFAQYSVVSGKKTDEDKDRMIISFHYSTNNINKLPTKSDMDSNKMISQMTDIVDSIKWK